MAPLTPALLVEKQIRVHNNHSGPGSSSRRAWFFCGYWV